MITGGSDPSKIGGRGRFGHIEIDESRGNWINSLKTKAAILFLVGGREVQFGIPGRVLSWYFL